jgi:hypothetical protein
MSNFDLINTICKKNKLKLLHKLPNQIKNIFIQYAYNSLYQKTGNRNLAKNILIELGEIEDKLDILIYTGKNNLKEPIIQLIRQGITTIPIIPLNEISKYRKDFIDTVQNFPEYIQNKDLNKIYILGGFAALGNPSSFHNLFVRNLRIKCREQVISKIFKNYINKYDDIKLKENYKLEMLYDRMMDRLAGQKPSDDAWHRDVVVNNVIEENDELFGGWINLDETNQYFSCIPGSHLNIIQKNIRSGFNTLYIHYLNILKNKQKNELKGLNNDEIEKKLKPIVTKYINKISKLKTKFIVPPGHMVIFPQYILHEVISTLTKHNMKRLFLGWRLTTTEYSLYDKLISQGLNYIFDNQSVPPLPSAQKPPIYSKQHEMSFIGIPKLLILNKKQLDKFNYKKWGKEISEKFLKIYSSNNMKLLYQKITSKLSLIELKNILYNMILEYKKQGLGIHFEINKTELLEKNVIIKFTPFKIISNDKNSITTLIKWSYENIQPKILNKKINSKGNSYYITDRYMKSLKEYDFPLYPKYTINEKLLYTPQKIT